MKRHDMLVDKKPLARQRGKMYSRTAQHDWRWAQSANFKVFYCTVRGLCTYSLAHYMASVEESIASISRRVKNFSKMNFASWEGLKNYNSESAVNSRNSKKVAEKVTNMVSAGQPTHAKQVIHFQKPDGAKATRLLEDREVIRDYFAEMFKAELVTFAEAIRRDRDDRNLAAQTRSLPDLDESIIPNLYGVAISFAHKKTDRAPGEDCRGGIFITPILRRCRRYISPWP